MSRGSARGALAPGVDYPAGVSLEEPADRAARAALRVGHVPGVTLTKWRRVWAERLPDTPLEVVEVTQADQRAALSDGRVAMCFVRLPVEGDGLHLIRLYDEVPVVVAPKDHPVAAFDELRLADLAGEPLVPDGPDAFDKVAWGAGLLLVPHSVARSGSRRDLVMRPITDAEPTTVALAWLAAPAATDPGRDALVEEFVGIVRGRTARSARTTADRAARRPPAEPDRRRPPATGAPGRRRRPGRRR